MLLVALLAGCASPERFNGIAIGETPTLITRPHYQHDPEMMLNGWSMESAWDTFAPKYSHWVIVIGFTDTKVILQDPAAGRMMVTRAKFDDWWKAKRRTCVLVTP